MASVEDMAEVLELAKYKVLTARNGKEGVEVAIAQKPNLIVCDIMMPELDGYGVIHMLQRILICSMFLYLFNRQS